MYAIRSYYDDRLIHGGGSGPVNPTAPKAPANPKATAGDAKVDLSWSKASGADNYTVHRATVITSYSIHYTKLYESWAGALSGCILPQVNRLIWTKRLRLAIHGEPISKASGITNGHMPGMTNTMVPSYCSVITSYSIHYTKLYETFICRRRNSENG